MLLAACLWSGWAHAAVPSETQKKPIPTGPRAVPKGDLVLPALAAGLPQGSAGCVVIWHHVVAGRSEKPRVLTGAFTANVDAGHQQAFAVAAIDAARRWQFEPKVPGSGESAFRMETLGFLPTADGRMHVAVGVDNQHERLRDACRVDDLAAWGEQNAVSVQLARERNGDKVLLRQPGETAWFWIAAAMAPPRYPLGAAMADISACVVVGFIVGEDGAVRDVRIMATEYSTPPLRPVRNQLEAAAAIAAGQWRFSPTPDNLGRIAEFMQAPVTFNTASDSWKPRACVGSDVHALIATGK